MTPRTFINKNSTPAVPVPRTDNRQDALWMENVRERLKKLENDIAALRESTLAMIDDEISDGGGGGSGTGLTFIGTWDASVGNAPSDNPDLGSYWIVTVAGNAVLGTTNFWQVGDLAVYDGTVGWFKVANTGIFRDSEFFLLDNLDQSKIGVFQSSSISPSTTRTYTLPDQDGDVAAVSTDGIVVHDGPASFVTRTITGTAGEIDVVNGNGVAGNPTLSLPDTLDFTGKTIDGGTYTNATLTAPTIGDFTNAQHDHLDADDGGVLTSAAISDFVEAAQDAVGGILTDSATVDFTYDDALNTITAAVLDSPLLQGQNGAFYLARANHTGTQTAASISDFNEAAQDAVGGILTDTATLNFTYDDATPAITADVLDSPLLQGQNGAYYLARANHTGTQLAATISNFNAAVDAQTLTNRQPLDSTLTALAAYNTNGILTQTAADTFTGRTITGTANEITATNGNGVSGNPTLSLPAALTFTGKTVTGGTFTAPTINVNDDVFTLRDNVDTTKLMQFQLSGITTGTTRTLTAPNASGTIALTADLAAYQPLDADLTSWAGVTRAAGFDTFAATPSSANLAALVTNETGTGALVFGTAPTITGATLNDIASGAQVGNGVGGSNFTIDSAAGASGNLLFQDAGVNRWALQKTTSSNFLIGAFDVTGAFIDAPIQIANAAGGTLTIGRPTAFGANAISGSAAAFTGGSFSGGAFNGTLGATTPSTVVGTTGNFTTSLSAPDMIVSGAAATNRLLQYRTGSSNRWVLFASATAESGGDAGSDLVLNSYTDAGVLIDTPINIVRAAGGAITIARPTAFGANAISGSAAAFTGGSFSGGVFNGTLGETTPSTAVVTTLFANANGSATTARIGRDANNGLFFGTNLVAIASNGIETARFGSRTVTLGATANTDTVSLEVGTGRTGSGVALLDFVGDTTYTDFGLRVIRAAGANAGSSITSRGTGALTFTVVEAGDIVFATTGTERLRVTSDGRLYGTALHNNAGSVTGTTNQYIASGTYTPTGTAGTNCAAVTPGKAIWIRTGNVVHVVASVTIDATASATLTEADLSLPIASAFTTATDLSGSGASTTTNDAASVFANATNDRATIRIAVVSTAVALVYKVTFSYEVL